MTLKRTRMCPLFMVFGYVTFQVAVRSQIAIVLRCEAGQLRRCLRPSAAFFVIYPVFSLFLHIGRVSSSLALPWVRL